jgi:calcineurin-like phosphoesterase family protein
MRVCVVGDLHAAPGMNLDHVDHIASHIEATSPDAVVLIGDVCTFDSVSTHDPLGSLQAKTQPSIAEDFAVLEDVLERLDGLGGELHVTLGNHEERLRRYEDSDARLAGSIWPRLIGTYKAYGFEVTDYGSFLDLNGSGVNFTHIPLNIMRRPYANIDAIAREAKWPIVYGHSHEQNVKTARKIGGGFTILNVPCSLPHGHVEKYALKTTTTWSWAISDLEIHDGQIGGYAFRPMNWLRKTYG